MSNRSEIRKEKKRIQKMAIKGSFKDLSGKHHKWTWQMYNRHGEVVDLWVTLSRTPSDNNWKKIHHANINRQLRDLDIIGYRINDNIISLNRYPDCVYI